MNFGLLLNLYKSKKLANSRRFELRTLVKYYVKLKIGEITKHIYKNPQNFSTIEIPHAREAMETIDRSIRNTLNKLNIGNVIDISKKIGLENIGVGCVITPAMFGNLIAVSQNNTSFYFITRDIKQYTLKMNLLAIPSISGHIKFEEKIIHSFSISTLAESNISLVIKPEIITNKVSKITISVDKCWSPHFLDKDLPDFPLGVGIRFIELSATL